MQLLANAASTALAADLAIDGASLVVTGLSSFPVIVNADDWFLAILTDAGETVHEEVLVTATSGTTWEITRAQDDTSAAAWPAGTKVEQRQTAAMLRALAVHIAKGDVVLDFGSTGTCEASVTVTGQTGITAASKVFAQLVPAATADHTALDHRYASAFMGLTVGDIIPGTGFTIHATTTTTFKGTFNAHWFWA